MIRQWIQRLIGDQPEYVALRREHARQLNNVRAANGNASSVQKRLNAANMRIVGLQAQLRTLDSDWRIQLAEVYRAYDEQLAGLHPELRAELLRLRDDLTVARAAIGWVLEYQDPPGECSKIKFETNESAQELADRLERAGNGPMKIYSCDVCLRHPFLGTRYRHVGHVETRRSREMRGCLNTRPGKPVGPTIAHRLEAS